MTPDAQGPGPDDAPTPPAQTRWTEEGVADDDALMPPYVPGGTPGEASSAESADRQPEEPFPFETNTPGEEGSNEAFPFETDTPGEGGSDEAFPFEADASEGDVDDGEPYPFEAEAAGPSTVEPEVADTAEEAFPFEATDPGEGDDFPFDAFDLGEAEAPAPQPELHDGPEGLPSTGSTEVADRLEWLAQMLRTEGRPGLEREAATGERLTSLIAGVLAGYLAGRGD